MFVGAIAGGAATAGSGNAKGMIVGAFLGLASNLIGSGGSGAIGHIALQAVIGGGKILANNAVAMPSVAPKPVSASNVGLASSDQTVSNPDGIVKDAMYASNSGNNSPNWGSQKGFYIHQKANLYALVIATRAKKIEIKDDKDFHTKIQAMDDGTVWADGSEHQTGETSFMHAMHNSSKFSAIGEDIEVAMIKSDRFVRLCFEKAKIALNLTSSLQARM